ncbi:MAG: NADH-quinone oxidoreductase subunit K [Phycisphaerales bacterium]|nr:NADH-quinone oxidoreductase subunit K [Phycisphaerales bacterium]
MTPDALMGIAAAALIGIGLAGAILNQARLRRIIGCNLMGGGVLLLLGAVALRGAGSDLLADPVPQAMIITGIVVAFAGTALAVGLSARVAEGAAEETLRIGGEAIEPPGTRAE